MGMGKLCRAKQWLFFICSDSQECYSEPSASDYRGSVSVTESGETCQAWNAQSPHRHLFKEATHASSGIGSHNYCRNPDGKPSAWCYTTNQNKRWELCNVGQPQSDCDEGECMGCIKWASISLAECCIHMLRYTGMCRPNGLLFHQKSLVMGPILVKKSLKGPISQNLRKNGKISRF